MAIVNSGQLKAGRDGKRTFLTVKVSRKVVKAKEEKKKPYNHYDNAYRGFNHYSTLSHPDCFSTFSRGSTPISFSEGKRIV